VAGRASALSECHIIDSHSTDVQRCSPVIDDRRSLTPKPPLTLQNVHDDAIKQLQNVGRLSSDEYTRIAGTTLQDRLTAIDTAVKDARSTNAARIGGVFKSLLGRLEKFESAIDILAQSSPQILGLSLVGLIWGSLKILLVVSFVSARLS
jgi:hypothetical protein